MKKNYYITHKEEILKKSKEFYLKNKIKIIEKVKQRTEENKEKYLEYQKNYRKLNRDKLLIYFKNRWKNNKVKMIHDNDIRKFKRYHSDINFRLRESLSARIRMAIKRNYKVTSSVNLIGCSIKFLKQHLENQFKLGMTWKNYGKWHVDHIIPCASFDLSKREEQIKCFNYKNLQPLWAKENIAKSDKII